MKQEGKLLWIVRISWPLLGGIWGALLGLGGLLQLPQNADSFGTVFAQGFFIIAACIGLLAGGACGVLVGGLTEKLLLRLGVRAASAVCVATVVNAIVIWQLAGLIQNKYPGFRPPVEKSDGASPTSSKTRQVTQPLGGRQSAR
ncbi:MAG: hypothetical protein IPQ16_11720 [Geobacteraceae bacterium]|nr:hypothetical protein [Geobacteraceae bacterium]